MRARYLKAVLRQDVGYFDLHVTSTAEVITSVSNDSLVIQDVLSEKVNVLKQSFYYKEKFKNQIQHKSIDYVIKILNCDHTIKLRKKNHYFFNLLSYGTN